MTPKTDFTLDPHPDFDIYSENEIKDKIREISDQISFGSSNGAGQLWVSYMIQERRLAEAALQRRHGNGNGNHAQQDDFWPVPVPISEIKNAIFKQEWVWDNLLPFGEIGMLAGEPRAGKTTLALNLAVAISRGYPFLGRKTQKCRCLYVSIDNSARDMKVIIDQLEIRDDDDIKIHVGGIPSNATDWLLQMIEKVEAKFAIVDTMERFYPKYDINKPEFSKAMVPLDLEIKKMGATAMYVHHATAKAHPDAPVGSLFMGNTAVKGMTPYYMELIRLGEARHRILSTDLRSGENLDGAFIKIDRTTGWTVKAGNREDAMIDEAKNRVIEFLEQNESGSRSEIRDAIQCRKLFTNMAIQRLLLEGRIERLDPTVNNGKKGHPEILVLAQILT